jgi:hypothetical protein
MGTDTTTEKLAAAAAFQDPYTLNVMQLMKCCVEQITPDGRLIPFCAYNTVGYREQGASGRRGAQRHPVCGHCWPIRRTGRRSPPATDGGDDHRGPHRSRSRRAARPRTART